MRSVVFCCSIAKYFGDSSFEDCRVKAHGIYEIRAKIDANSFQNRQKNDPKSMKNRQKLVSEALLEHFWSISGPKVVPRVIFGRFWGAFWGHFGAIFRMQIRLIF